MKTAEALIDHILGCVRPPRHHRIELLEQAGEPNWIATMGVIELTYLEQFITKVIELRKSDRLIDWDGVTEQEWGHRRITKSLSEIDHVPFVDRHSKSHQDAVRLWPSPAHAA
jgi:hypothetical protein